MNGRPVPPVAPQRVNRGGNLSPEEVVGRDEFIAGLWEAIDSQSLLLTAERRMGKTSVVKKMRAEPRSGLIAVYRSFEHVRSRAEFVDAILRDVGPDMPLSIRAGRRLRRVLDDLNLRVSYGDFQAAFVLRDDWKEIIPRVFDAMADVGRVVFLWDEVPVMVGTVAEREGADAARELLDVLRVVRQTCDHARMVFTGSIGLHHVLAGIRPDSYSRAPVNDMRPVVLGGLDREHAVQLARNLCAGEGVGVASDPGVAEAVAEATSDIPFYVQHVVGALSDAGFDRPVDVHDAHDAISEALRSPVDPWDMRQYRRRITSYYGEDERTVLSILDAVATADAPLSLHGLVNRVRAQHDVDIEDVRRLLDLLQLDHYIVKNEDGYRFAFGIVARAWREQRDLR